MKTSPLKSQFYLLTANSTFLIPTKTTSYLKLSSVPSRTTTTHGQFLKYPTKVSHVDKPLHLNLIPKCQKTPNEDLFQVSSNEYSRYVLFGAASLGFVLLLMGMDDQKALAWGPEGPLVEEFWDNVRRYALYALTVSTGAIYTIFLPIFELLKNPISAILILAILGGGIYIVSQVLSAMIGVSDFNYDYGY